MPEHERGVSSWSRSAGDQRPGLIERHGEPTKPDVLPTSPYGHADVLPDEHRTGAPPPVMDERGFRRKFAEKWCAMQVTCDPAASKAWSTPDACVDAESQPSALPACGAYRGEPVNRCLDTLSGDCSTWTSGSWRDVCGAALGCGQLPS